MSSAANTVISETQARAITGGRKPLVPVCYESACKALSECLSIDDAKLWDAKSDALAAWAKIYRDDDAMRKARALKLHAFRRMGELSKELTKAKPKYDANGPVPGARSLLIDKGLKVHDADACIRLAKAPIRMFEKALRLPKPPAPSNFMHKDRDTELSDMAALVKRAFIESVPFCKQQNATACKKAVTLADLGKLRENLVIVYEWLDMFLYQSGKK